MLTGPGPAFSPCTTFLATLARARSTPAGTITCAPNIASVCGALLATAVEPARHDIGLHILRNHDARRSLPSIVRGWGLEGDRQGRKTMVHEPAGSTDRRSEPRRGAVSIRLGYHRRADPRETAAGAPQQAGRRPRAASRAALVRRSLASARSCPAARSPASTSPRVLAATGWGRTDQRRSMSHPTTSPVTNAMATLINGCSSILLSARRNCC